MYHCSTPTGGYFFPVGIVAASCETLGGAGWGRRRLLKVLCRLVGEAWVGEAWSHRLAPGTTWVSRLTAFPVRASSDPQPGDAHGRRRSRSVGVAATLGRVAPFSPVDPEFPRFSGARTGGCSGNLAIVAQLRQAPLVSPPAPTFSTGAAVVSSRRLAPRNVRSDGFARLSSAGARVSTPSSARRRDPLAMAFGAAGAVFLLASVRRDLSDILVKNGGPRPVNRVRRRQRR